MDLTRVTVGASKKCGDAFILELDYRPDFIPGQMVGLSLVSEPRPAPRLYSIASPPGSPVLEILYTEVEGGELTPRLSTCEPGDELLITPPRGEFTDSPESRSWWIANGTGVAPFMSMARSGMGEHKTLIHGAREPENFFGSEYFTAPDSSLHYVPCCSRPELLADSPLEKTAHPGRLTSWLVSQNSLPAKCTYHLCGSEQMILQVRDILLQKGVDFSAIISEIYF